MKHKKDNLKKLLILNALFLLLSIVITINLIETGGSATASVSQPAVTQPAS
jgi:hypothetical protein